MSPRLYARSLWREMRGARGKMLFFTLCLAVGVAAVVSVAGLSAALDAGIRGEARQLLAADLAVSGRRPLPADLDDRLAALGADARVDVVEMVTVVAAPPAADGTPGPSLLVEVKAVGEAVGEASGGYPFYGELNLEPPRRLGELLDETTVVAAPALLTRLGLGVGDRLRVGGEDFTVAGRVLAEPDDVGVGFTLGPRLFLSRAGLERAALIQRGSRVEYRALVRMPEDTPAAVLADGVEELRGALTPGWRVESWREAQPALRQGVARVDRFLALVALLSLLAGGIGVAQTVRAWLAGRLDAIAVLKCIGWTPREVTTLFVGQTALLGLAGSLVGIAAGIAVQLAIPALFPDLVPRRLIDPFQPLAMLRGLVLGLGVALLFSLPPLATVRQVPPARVLRRDAQPLPLARWAYAATGLALVGGLVAMAALQARSLPLGLGFAAGVAVATLLLAAMARVLVAGVGRLPALAVMTPRRGRRGGRGRVWWRHGLSALARPGAGTLAAVVALGLGTLVVLAMALVQRHLTDELAADLPDDAPSAFLADVQPDQWEEVQRVLAEGGAEDVRSVPVVMARVAALDGETADDLAEERGVGGPRSDDPDADDGTRRWALTREQRLTYLDELPRGNEIVAGALWSDPEVAEVSVEEEFARELGVGLGSTIDFDVQGVPLRVVVTSLRRVDWGTFGINFFLVVEPGVLEAAPQQRLATVRLPRGGEQAMQDALTARFPNVVMIQIREILEKIVGILERISLAIRLLGGFTVLAGLAILAGAVAAAAAQRGREVALLKTLGFTRFQVAAAFAVEYAAVGLVAGAIGAVGGGLLAWLVVSGEMELGWRWYPAAFAAALFGMALLATAAGLAASWRALARRPVEVLRRV